MKNDRDEFEKWWSLLNVTGSIHLLTPKEIAQIAWECAAENERIKSLAITDEIITTSSSHPKQK